MIRDLLDTIVAPISGPGPSAISVVRLSGPEAFSIASRVFRPWPVLPTPRSAIYGDFFHGDDGLALPFPAGHSYTGDEVVELSVHGSRASVNGLVEACQREGARLARAGEFTMRAFLNGRIDLSQAEAVADTIEAETAAQLKVSGRNRRGQLRDAVERIRSEAIGALAAIEASIDFSEEIGDLDHAAVAKAAETIERDLRHMLETGKASFLTRKGMRIAIAGLPNAGKSSLLNALLQRDRAIVTPIPGTTRDYLEESLDLDGFKVVLVDTAGLRDTGDEIEKLGIERSIQAVESADWVWYLFDAAAGWSDDDERFWFPLPAGRTTIIANKIDLADRNSKRDFAISAQTLEGLSELKAAIRARCADNGEPYVNERQSVLLEEAARAMGELQKLAQNLAPPDLLAVVLTEAIATLGEVTGATANPDLLGEIFSRFCIGK